MAKTRKVRKSPAESATSLPEGTIKGNWVIKKASNGVPRWIPKASAELNGFHLFTTDIAAKHIGKPIVLYCREYKETWPKKSAWSKPADSTHVKFKFVPSGDALKDKTVLEGWLKTQKPSVKPGTHFSISGPLYECRGASCTDSIADGVQLDSGDGKTLSVNLMNTETFVKV